MSENAAILTRDLIKFYGDFQALFGVDLEVRRGEIFGLLDAVQSKRASRHQQTETFVIRSYTWFLYLQNKIVGF